MSQLARLLHWIDAHNGAATAIATIFIALFTIVLAWVSWRQARLIGRQIELAREEFRATHRPKLVIRACKIRLKDMTGDHMVPCQMTFHNEGVSPAHIREIGIRVWEGDYPWTSGAQEIYFKTEKRADVLRSGEDMTFWTGKDFNTDRIQTTNWFFAGYIKYSDLPEGGTIRKVGFIRKWRGQLDVPLPDHKWEKFDNEEYEYPG